MTPGIGRTGSSRVAAVYTTERYGYSDCTVTAADGSEVTRRSDMTAQDLPGWYSVGEIVGKDDYFVSCRDSSAGGSVGTFGVGPSYGIGTVLFRWLLFIVAAALISGSVVVLCLRSGGRDRRRFG